MSIINNVKYKKKLNILLHISLFINKNINKNFKLKHKYDSSQLI